MMPNNRKMDKIGSGIKVNGVSTTNATSLKLVFVQPIASLPKIEYNESLNRSIKETPLPSKSIMNMNEIRSFAVEPYDAYPRSAYVINVWSVSMDLDINVAVQHVVPQHKSKMGIAKTHPPFDKPTGNANKPTPMRQLTEFKMVWGPVDWPAMTVTRFPSLSSIFFKPKYDAVVAHERVSL